MPSGHNFLNDPFLFHLWEDVTLNLVTEEMFSRVQVYIGTAVYMPAAVYW